MSFIPSGWPGRAGTWPCRGSEGKRRCAKQVARNPTTGGAVTGQDRKKEAPLRSILLWLIGIPIPVIILLYLFGVL
jgi:hypothetical protein